MYDPPARLAWREGSSEAGLVKETDLEDVVRPASALRGRQVLSFSSPDARRIVITRGAVTVTLARASEQAPWKVKEGSGKAEVVRPGR